MNNQEGIDLMKMTVTVLLVVLVIGAVLALFYLLTNSHYKTVKSMEDAMSSSSMERLYELRDRSDTIVHEEHPLVSNVASVLSEFNETDLLYILIDVPIVTDTGTTRKTTIYTYDGVDASRVPSGYEINTSSAPTSQAYKEVIRYSDKRCQVDLDTPEGMLAIKIIVCN